MSKPSFNPRGRPLKFSDERLIMLLENLEMTVSQAALRLNCTVQTIYNRLKLMSPDKRPSFSAQGRVLEKTKTIFDAYKGHRTLTTLAKKFEMTRTGIRVTLQRGMRLANGWREPHQSWIPLPETVKEIKLFNAVRENEDLYNFPDKLCEITKVDPRTTSNYVNRNFERKEHF